MSKFRYTGSSREVIELPLCVKGTAGRYFYGELLRDVVQKKKR